VNSSGSKLPHAASTLLSFREKIVEQEIATDQLLVEGLGVANDVYREVEASLTMKVSPNKVRCQRWHSPMEPVLGPPVIIDSVDRIAEGLAISGFMRPWIVDQIKTHLLSGGIFTNPGATMQDDEEPIVPNGQSVVVRPKSEYRMATEAEVLDYVDHAQFANLTGHRISARAQEKCWTLRYHEGPELIEAYDKLPKQARVVLDLLNDTGREQFTEASIEVILTEHADALKTKQEPMKIWGFYRSRFLTEGHIEEAG
jgi:hypothetical protein